MTFNQEKKHLYVQIPKTGSDSLRIMLEQAGWDSTMIKNIGRHATLLELENKLKLSNDLDLLNELNSYYKTTCIRNPWERAVSEYIYLLSNRNFWWVNSFKHKNFKKLNDKDKLNLDLSFKRFIKKGYLSQSEFLKSKNMSFDKIFNYSEYDKMLDFLEKKYNVTFNRNIRKHDRKNFNYVIDININKPYQEYYDDESYEIVKNLSKDIIEMFNYKF